MRYVSIFSGIEAASAAWDPLDWRPIAFAEINPFASAVLAHQYPLVPNVGDMLAFDWTKYCGECEVVIGGPPCQSFSNAGLRNSLDDNRGQLSLHFADAIHAISPAWSITENVPGWLNTDDNAFGTFLGRLVGDNAPLIPRGRWTNAGVASGPVRTAAWRILDAQYAGLAQRRRRVFVLSCLGSGNWDCAAALFPQCDRLSRDSPPSRKAGESVAGTLESSAGNGRGWRLGADEAAAGFSVAHTLKGTGHDASEDGTGRGVPLVAMPLKANGGWLRGEDHETYIPTEWPAETAHTLDASYARLYGQDNQHIDDGATLFVPDVSPALKARDRKGPSSNGDDDGAPLVAVFDEAQITSGENRASVEHGQPAPSLSKDSRLRLIGLGVRRITPVEAERLQGFPDNWTNVPYRGKPAKDGPRMEALGNSMAVPVIRWLGRRIELIERLKRERT